MPTVQELLRIAAIRRRRRAGARVIFADDFDRADSATTLGSDWTAITGTFGINSNQAYNPSVTDAAIAVHDAGAADCTVSVTLAFKNSGAGLYIRVKDASNWLRYAYAGSGAMQLQKCVAGTVSTVATVFGFTAVNGDTYAVTMSGTTITMYLNGVQVGDPKTVTEHATETKHGIGNTSGLAALRWDDFKVTA